MKTYIGEYGLEMPVGFKLPKDVEDHDWLGSGWNQYLVPESICGVSIKKSGCIHDEMYKLGKTEKEKIQADKVFKRNLTTQTNECDLIFKNSARFAVYMYYKAVRDCGHSFFWDGKVKPENS